MGDYFEFRDKSARMQFALGLKSRSERGEVVRYNLVFDSLDDLGTLLSMGSEEIVTLDGERMPYKQFRESYLSNANRIYTNPETEFIDIVGMSGVLERLIEKGHF